MRKDLAAMSVATAISGAISGYFLPAFFQFGPGILFGTATAIILLRQKTIDLVQAFLWLMGSTAGWYLAVVYYIHVAAPAPGTPNPNTMLPMMISGLIGSTILGLTLGLLRRTIDLAFAYTVTAGIIMAIVMHIILSLQGQNNQTGSILMALAFMAWQVGVGLALTAYKSKKKLKTKKTT